MTSIILFEKIQFMNMDLNRFTPKNRFEDLLLSIAENRQTLVIQTQTKPEETFEFQVNKSKETFSFINTPLEIERDWLIVLTSWKVSHSVFEITNEINKYKFYDKKIHNEETLTLRRYTFR